MTSSKEITLPGSSYQELFEDAPVAYHELDAQGIITRVNRAECQLLGFAAEEMLGRPIWDFIAGEEQTQSQRSLVRKLSGEQPLAPFVRLYLTRDHRPVYVEIHDRLIRDGTGRAVGIRSTLIDVTHRVSAESALAESQRWMSTILRCLCDAVLVVDTLDSVKFMNPAAEQLVGWSQADAIGREVDSILSLEGIHSGGTVGEIISSSLFDTWVGSATLTRRDHTRIPVDVTAAPIVTETDTVLGVVLVVRGPRSRPCDIPVC